VARRLGHLLLLLALARWTWLFLAWPMRRDVIGASFLHTVSIPFHEAGHILFLPLGAFMTSLGGSLAQVLVPVACMAAFLTTSPNPFGAAAMAWWAGQNLMDVALYINDARALELVLIGGRTGAEVEGHDWEYILSAARLLHRDQDIAWAVHSCGAAVMVGALVWAMWLARPRVGMAAGALLGALASASCGGPALPQTQTAAARARFDLEEATIADLQQRMERGEETARSLVEKYTARIAQLDREGPALRSIIELNPEAAAIADRLDAERRTKGARGLLHGIPILIKDNIGTADRMTTTAGSLALEGVHAPQDAFVVSRLRDAGAVILGKTNLSEWANFRSTHSSSGWSARGGQTKNPYALDRSPCGSSSGSAVAVAANLAAAAIGTETDGSIVCPAHSTSIVGLKPTLGLVSRAGIVPIAHTQDTAGPMARTVADAAALLAAIDGVDGNDAATAGAAEHARREYAAALDANGLQGARVGIVRDKLFGYSPAADRLADLAITVMKEHGAVIVDPANIPTLGSFEASEFDVLLYEFKADLNKYLAWLGPASPVRSLKDVIAFNRTRQHEELRYFGQEIMEMADAKGPLTSPEYVRALERNRRLTQTQGIDAVMATHRLDALVAPSFGPPWLVDLVSGDTWPAGASSPSSVAAVAGYPHITVPMGYFRGLPLGISFIGRAWSEPTLLRLAYAFEQITMHRKAPRFLPTLA
jgi:amidase